MTSFTKKTIEPTKRVCLRLKEAREASGVSLTAVSNKTKIDKAYLIALEECRFDDLPEAVVYQKNFIKKYLRAIGVNSKPFIAQYMMEEGHDKISPPKHPLKTISKIRFHNIPMLVKRGLTVMLVLVLLGYLAFQVYNILEPPQLVIDSPRNGLVTTEPSIVIKGNTGTEVRITVNGKEIMNNNSGEFQEEIDLSPGINELLISATKKHGKTTEEVRHVILKQIQKISDSRSITPDM